MHLSIAELQEIVGGRLRLGAMPPRDGECTGVGKIVTDSRRVDAGDVFWGVKGASSTVRSLPRRRVARRERAGNERAVGGPWAGGWTLEVEDSLAALWRLAAWRCDRFKGHLSTVEGDVGTSTAAMIAGVLEVRHVGQTVSSRPGETNAAFAAR